MRKIVLILVSTLLFGCVTVTKPVSLNPSFWQARDKPVGIATTVAQPPTAYMIGDQGLLDIVINRANAAKLMDHLAKLETPKLKSLPNDFGSQLQARGFKVVYITEPVDPEKLPKFSGKSGTTQFAERDYRSFKEKRNFKEQGVDKLLVISVDAVGTIRSYWGFLPGGPPQADIALHGQLIDLNTNELLWYEKIAGVKAVPEPWDQEPAFPNVTDTITKDTDESIEKLEQSFFSGPVQ
ncbi:MAG TPA: hypothetical protein VIE17_06685 [Methylophilaceae bacterium]|jgi:hypothetical protein